MFARLALALGSTVFCLMLFELAFRASGSFAPAAKPQWSDRPSFYYSHERAGSFRDMPYSPEKAPGTFRVAVIGDSFAFAPYMQVDDTFAKRLERMLNLNGSQRRVEVINYGVPRYSTSHEVGLVEQALREQADLILLQITLNDPEIKPYTPTGLLGGTVNRFGDVEFKEGFLAHWKSAAFVAKRWYNKQSKQKYINYFFGLFDNKRSWNNFSRSIERIRGLTQKAGVPLAAVVFPLFGLPLDESYPFLPLHKKVGDYLESLQIPHADLYERFAGIPIDRLQVIVAQDFHPNEIGHRMAAEEIYQFLERSGSLPEDVRIKIKKKERIDIRLQASADAGTAGLQASQTP